MGAEHVGRFLSELAVRGKVSPSTQNQALAALLFLFREVLEKELPRLDRIQPARRRRRLPEVLTREEVGRVLGEMSGPTRLMATLLYGSGLRLMDCCRLRIKDLDLSAVRLVVREGKGGTGSRSGPSGSTRKAKKPSSKRLHDGTQRGDNYLDTRRLSSDTIHQFHFPTAVAVE
ncbi:MAG: phage integrase N-terminal SAM-like domain-containing protein [Planctomycetes bacterium]|nr:phage integrase N-terminal SAM-like domain-containing protein [Planctomycetota bacterium]